MTQGRSKDRYYSFLCGESEEQARGEAWDLRVRHFSKGMRQNLGIALTMVKDAPAILLDEPMSGLDSQLAAELVQTLKELRGRGKPILPSWHNRSFDG